MNVCSDCITGSVNDFREYKRIPCHIIYKLLLELAI